MPINCKIELKGNLGQDPKMIKPENGKEFTVLSVATTDSYKDANGAWVNKETLWHEVLIFKTTAITAAKDFKKGDRVRIEGSLSYKQIETKEGHKIPQASIIAYQIAKAPLASNEQPE